MSSVKGWLEGDEKILLCYSTQRADISSEAQVWMERQMNIEKFERIKSLYGGVASWACWSPQSDPERPKSGIADLSVFDPQNSSNQINSLHTNFVLVGLNISRDDVSDKPWRNFHSNDPRATDYKIRSMLAGTKLMGAYMTDVFKDFPEPDAQKVLKFCRQNPDELKSQIATFRIEMEVVCEIKPTLVAFGDVAFEILLENLNNEFEIYKVPHYASRKSMEEMKAHCSKF